MSDLAARTSVICCLTSGTNFDCCDLAYLTERKSCAHTSPGSALYQGQSTSMITDPQTKEKQANTVIKNIYFLRYLP